jgi:hypothetical protein
VRKAEAFVAPAVKVAPKLVKVAPAVKETVGAWLTYLIFSQNQSNVVQACTRMFPAQNKGPNLCSPPANPTLLTMQAQVFTYVAWACPTLTQACLEKLNGKATTLLNTIENSLRKNPMAFDTICRVLQTLLGMTIREYCEANGKGIPSISSTSGSVAPPKNPPKGGSGKTTAGFGGIPPNFLSKLTAQLSTTVNALLKNCPAWLEKIVPFCKKKNEESKDPKKFDREVKKYALKLIFKLIDLPIDPEKNPMEFHARTYKIYEISSWSLVFPPSWMATAKESDVQKVEFSIYKEMDTIFNGAPDKYNNHFLKFHMYQNVITTLQEINTRNAKKLIKLLNTTYKHYPRNYNYYFTWKIKKMEEKSDLYTLLIRFQDLFRTNPKNPTELQDILNRSKELADDIIFYEKGYVVIGENSPVLPDLLREIFPEEKFESTLNTFIENIELKGIPKRWVYSPKNKR